MSAFLWCSLVVLAFLAGGMVGTLWATQNDMDRFVSLRHEMERTVMENIRSDFRVAFEKWLIERGLGR